MLFTEQSFYDARFLVMSESAQCIRGGGGIGTQSEKLLHSILKYSIEPREEYHEVKLLGSLCDIYNESGVFEIQTRSLYRLRPKLDKFLPEHKVHVIFPIAKSKILHWVDPSSGEISQGRRTSKVGRTSDALPELASLCSYLTHPNFRLYLVFLNVEEYRYLNGYGRDKKRHASRMERIPLSLDSVCSLHNAKDYTDAFLPDALRDGEFTQKEYEKVTRTKARFAYIALQILISFGIISHVGEQGRAFLYRYTKK